MVRILRPLLLVACLIFVLPGRAGAAEPVVCGSTFPVSATYEEKLRDFATRIGLDRVRAFLGTISSIVETGYAPTCYLRKDEAQARGWNPGDDLCRIETGLAIGAYPFENREGLLPRAYEGSYRIADLDYACGKRNARRLVYVEGQAGEWLFWVTLDHYKSYIPVPSP
ncbi:MAG: ribonuclease domain-containing protein [Alphaproteobacteria bacterium]